MENTNVAIVGAGAAGLATARDLSGIGLRVVVLEARQRTGGRIETVRPPGCGVPVELGAEFIHGRAEETLRVARAAGAPAVEIPDVHWRRTARGFETRDFWGSVARVLSRVPGRGDRSAAEFLRSLRRVAPADRRLVRSFVAGARLLFAGEATAADETGTVAGALASGRRAARELRPIFGLGRVGEDRR